MTTTAVEIASKGLKRILVQGADAPLEPDEYQDFYTAMNHYMATLQARGIVLGYTDVSDAADVITVPPGAIEAIAANVAIRCASDYGAAVPATLVEEAREGRQTLSLIAQSMPQMALDPNLPIGSGSAGCATSYPATYGERVSALITLAGNTLVTEMGGVTGNVLKVRGIWDRPRHENLIADITGRLTSIASDAVTLAHEITFTAKATGSVAAATFAIIKNGDTGGAELSQMITPALSSAQSSHTLRVSLRLLPGEYVEFWAGDIFGSEDITVTDAVWEVS